MSKIKDFLEKNIDLKNKKALVIKFVFSLGLLLWYSYFWTSRFFVVTATASVKEHISVGRMIFISLLSIVFLFLIFLDNNFKEKTKNRLSIIFIILVPFLSYFALEFSNNALIRQGNPLYLLLNIFIMVMILLPILIISNSITITSIIFSIIICVIAIGDYFVYSIRGLPILAADFFSFKTAMSVAGNYEFKLNYFTYACVLMTFGICILSVKVRSFKLFNIKKRFITVAIYAVMMPVFLQTYVYSNFLSKVGIELTIFAPMPEYRMYGSLLGFTRSVGYVLVYEPENYSLNKVSSIALTYDDENLSQDNTHNPNIIVIMDEAFSDLQSVVDFEVSEDYMPFIRGLKEDTVKGTMYVSVFGGNTANTEFEFLTGNSMAFMPDNTVVYQLNIKDTLPSMAYTLKDQGYEGNIALHPYRAGGFSRDKVYPLLGFDEFITQDNFISPQRIRKFISDEEDFNRIISEYEELRENSEAPFFLFNVTMQNHGGYADEEYPVESIIKMTGEVQNPKVEEYINLLKITDTAFSELVDYFSKVEEPTLIVFFGDHEPSLGKSTYNSLFGENIDDFTGEKVMDKYQVPFVIWANYDIAEETIEKISPNFLGAKVLDIAGVELTQYQEYLLELNKSISAINAFGYYDKSGEFYELEDETAPYYEDLQEYNILQYNEMFDIKNRENEFFFLKSDYR